MAKRKEWIGAANDLRIVVFDFDGTLVLQDSSWITIHKHFGTERAARVNLRDYEKGLIGYEEFMRRDISLWPHVTLASIAEILRANTKIRNNARRVVKSLHERGYQLAILSAGIDLIVGKVAREIGIHEYLANGLETDADGFLTGNGISRVEMLRKDIAMQRLLERCGFQPNECAVVGDSKYDLPLMESAGLSIAIDGDDQVRRAADIVVSELADIPEHFRAVSSATRQYNNHN